MNFGQHGLSTLEGRLCAGYWGHSKEKAQPCPEGAQRPQQKQKITKTFIVMRETPGRILAMHLLIFFAKSLTLTLTLTHLLATGKKGGIAILHKKEMYLKNNWLGWPLRATILKKNIHFDTDVLMFIEKSPLLMIIFVSPFLPGSYSFYLTHWDTIQTQEAERNTNIADCPQALYW